MFNLLKSIQPLHPMKVWMQYVSLFVATACLLVGLVLVFTKKPVTLESVALNAMQVDEIQRYEDEFKSELTHIVGGESENKPKETSLELEAVPQNEQEMTFNPCLETPLSGRVQAIFWRMPHALVFYQHGKQQSILKQGEQLEAAGQNWQLIRIEREALIWQHKEQGCHLKQPYVI